MGAGGFRAAGGARACLLALALATAAAAQEPSAPPLSPPPPPPLMGGEDPVPGKPERPADLRSDEERILPNMQRSVGVYAAVNVGLLGLDVHQGRFYGFAAGNLGVPLISGGTLGVFSVGAGGSFLLTGSAESAWTFDLFGLVTPGWQTNFFSFSGGTAPFVGLGVGAGFRYLHRSGFTLGIKLPIFGAAAGVGGSGAGSSAVIGAFFLGAAVALPILSFGFRF